MLATSTAAVTDIHPAGFTEPRRLARYYFNNVIGNPLDTTVAVHNLIFDGVLERFPNLRILAVHGGAFAAAYSGRMDHAWGARSDSHGSLPKPPTHYLRKFYFDISGVETYQRLTDPGRTAQPVSFGGNGEH